MRPGRRRTGPRADGRSRSTTRASGAPSRALRDPCERPARVLRDELVLAGGSALECGNVLRAAGVAERDGRVPAEPARVALRDVQALEPLAIPFEPGDEIDMGVALGKFGAPLLHAVVPRADVLADVAAVRLRAEQGAVRLGDRGGRLRPVGEAERRI